MDELAGYALRRGFAIENRGRSDSSETNRRFANDNRSACGSNAFHNQCPASPWELSILLREVQFYECSTCNVQPTVATCQWTALLMEAVDGSVRLHVCKDPS